MIEIITDGGKQYGYGHLRRSTSLAWALHDRGFAVRVTPLSEDGNIFLPDVPPSGGGSISVAVIDLPYDGDRQCKKYNKLNAKVIGLDYQGNGSPDINIAIVDHGKARHSKSTFTGLQYAIIRPEIKSLSPSLTGNGAVVMIGGGDINNSALKVADNIARIFEDVTLVIGPLYAGEFPTGRAYKIFAEPDNLPAIMAKCEWAVVNGGTTMMEMMCLGKAVYVLPQTEQEKNLALNIYEQSGILGVMAEDSDIVIPGADDVATVSNNAHNLVDGMGIDRIIEKIETLL